MTANGCRCCVPRRMAYDGGMASLKIIARLGILWASLAMLALPAAVQAQDITYETSNGANSHGLDPRVKRVLQAHKQDQWDLDISKLKMMSEDMTGFEKRMAGNIEIYKVPPPSNIQDAFHYSILMSRNREEFWIWRHGGIAGVSELYGTGVLQTNGTIRYVEPQQWHAARGYLWGKWEEKGNPKTFAVFTSTNITLSVNGTQEVWKVVDGTGLITGLKVICGDQTLEAKSTVKFNEMIFHIGRRMWLLRQAGSKNPDFEGELPNQPVN